MFEAVSGVIGVSVLIDINNKLIPLNDDFPSYAVPPLPLSTPTLPASFSKICPAGKGYSYQTYSGSLIITPQMLQLYPNLEQLLHPSQTDGKHQGGWLGWGGHIYPILIG